MIEPTRISALNSSPERPERAHVLYWMEASQRTVDNHALEFAIIRANELRKPLHVLHIHFPHRAHASLRHDSFMLDGLRDVVNDLARRGIAFSLLIGDPTELLPRLAIDAASIVTDRGYLRRQRYWREASVQSIDVRVWQVESDVVIPVDTASDKEEYAARTLRPKLARLVDRYLTLPAPQQIFVRSTDPINEVALDPSRHSDVSLKKSDPTVTPVAGVRGGEREAHRVLDRFCTERLSRYAAERNEPTARVTSQLSPYLHYGQISPIRIALSVIASAGPLDPNTESFLDELIVRRELAMNFVRYNERYDSYASLPDWARTTLDMHRDDRRDWIYSLEQLDEARTHDRYWNAAMIEMRETGRMAGYMRMYWGKKLIEWSETPEEAFEALTWLNDRYFLDGRDPVSYANIAWIFGKHDRPWARRPIFGTVRYLNAAGLKRKFLIDEYAERMERLDSRR